MSHTNRIRGFTLLEMLIASGIFAVILLLGFAIFASNSTVQAKVEAQRVVAQGARLSLESIAREIRLANGAFSISSQGQIRQTGVAFKLLDGTTDVMTNLTSGSRLEIASTNLNNVTQTTYRLISLEQLNNHTYVRMMECVDVTCTSGASAQMTPDAIEVTQLTFRGLMPVMANQANQPFVEINLKVQNGPEVPTQLVSTQALKTVVTSRNYQL